MKLDKKDTALMVVDMQNSFCVDGGGCARVGLPVENLAKAIEPCRQLIACAREAGIPIIYTRYVCRPDYTDAGVIFHELMPELIEAGALAAGSEDIEIVAELKPNDGDYIVDKNRPSAFYATSLETILRGLGTDKLVVCGVTTNCCVETTVRDASQRDYRTFVVEDAVAEFEDDRHKIALKSMDMLFADVLKLDDVRQAWQ